MPPKKGKGKKGKKAPMLIDGVDTSTMTRDQLEQFALKLKEEMEREREERNFFQLERDKIRTFWEITRGQLEETRFEVRNKDHEVEMAQELADVDTKHIMQQMKHLQYENQNKIGEIRAEAMTQLKLSQEYHDVQEQELLKDKRELRRLLREREETHELQTQQLKMKHNDEMAEARIQFQREAKDMDLLHEEKMKALRNEIELVYRMQMFEVEERKNTQIQRLIDSHDTAFNDMKNYYNDITLNNLGLISSLKDQLEVLRKQSERSERTATEVLAENRKLKEPLDAAQAELADLRRKMEHFERDRNQLARLKSRNTYIEKQLKSLTWETETLLLRNDTLKKEREELKAKFDEVVMELQQKTGLKNVLLERKVSMMERESEKRDMLLKKIQSMCGATGDAKQSLEKQINSVLDEKNQLIDDLRYELVRVVKAHDDLLGTYESKLLQFGIPQDELGFEPLRLSEKHRYLCGPAGLVTKNQ
ncbi:dynein regulatory complex subunit 4 [Anastrepha ludens]|uniref:dynein regulatory complex subunit 4 n=1 Tax=Anastrepha ludens TaxID=28586 RepID=UPI0023B0546B|nr:dynein regulatory complex subunit 4 [Anastrepha ludens]